MKEVVDRIVQYPNRYKLTDVSTGQELGTYDFTEEPGAVQQVGTEINKELFDSIEADIEAAVNFDPNGTYPNLTSGEATNATNDAQGRDIALTYATKSEIPEDVTINLNGQDVTDPAFYAPTAAGQAGQVLVSNGAGQAPTWQDAGKDISGAVVTLGPALTYNGSEQTQTVQSVVLDDIPLVEGIDYYISGNKQTNAGTYMLSVMGKSSYSGTATKEWTIAKAAAPAISVDKQSVSIVGAAGTTATVTVSASVSGTVSAQTSAPNVVTATVAGMVVTLTSTLASLQIAGSATISISFNAGSNYEIATIMVNVTVTSILQTLNDNSWEAIKTVSDADMGASYWAVGDTKSVTLNGKVGTLSLNTTLWAYILGFNHNSDREGTHRIHFGGFKTAQAGGVDVALVTNYGKTDTTGLKYFNINHWGYYNYGGWAACDMRYDIIGSTDVAPSGYGSAKTEGATGNNPTSTCTTNPVANTLMAALPADLRAVMKPVTKYTDNKGGNSNAASNVTATTDYLWLLAEYEVQGTRTYANSSEQDYQEQYDYYANGNPKTKKQHTNISTGAKWYARSPGTVYNTSFCFISIQGFSDYTAAYYSYGLAPAFAV